MEEKRLAECEPQTEARGVDTNTTEETEEFLEITLTEAWKKGIVAIGRIRLWHVLGLIMLVSVLFSAYFVIPVICGVIWDVIKHPILTMIGYGIEYYDRYCLLDVDLLYSFPVCLAVSLFVANTEAIKKTTYGCLLGGVYFFMLIGLIEYFDYSHIAHWYKEEYWTNFHSAWLGGITFAIFFIVIPILLWICPTATSQEETEETDAKNICPEG